MRYFAYTDDPVAGGSSLTDLVDVGTTPTWPTPDELVPVMPGANVEPNLAVRDRNDEARGRRAGVAPESWTAAPAFNFECRAYRRITQGMIRRVLAGTPAVSGTAPAAITSVIAPTQDQSGGNLDCIIGALVRDGQIDRISGAAIEEVEMNFPLDGDGTIRVAGQALYHDVDTEAAVALPTPTAQLRNSGTTYNLRSLTAYIGAGAGTLVDCIAGFGFTFSNNFTDDMRARFCAGKNVEETILEGARHVLWYPDRHRPGRQQVTGRIDFGETRPDRELRRVLSHADKLVVEVTAGPITPASTPPADELMRLTFYRHVLTGGGADPLADDGQQYSSYEFTSYLDTTLDKDVEATFVTDHTLVAYA